MLNKLKTEAPQVVKPTKESVKFDQEKMLDEYRNEADSLRQQILDLKSELKNLNDTFKEQYAERLSKLEADEAQIQKYFEHNDQITRDYNTSQAEFQQQKEDFSKEQEQTRLETQQLIKHNNGLLDEINTKKLQDEETLRHDQAILDENENVLGQIKSQQKALELLTNKKGDIDLLNAKLKEADDLRDLYQNKMKEIDAKKLELHLEQDKLDEKIRQSKSQAEQARREMQALIDMTEENNKLIKRNKEILDQTLAERDKNNAKALENKAKDKLLGEKEIDLNKREINVKIVEAEEAQKQGESNG